MLGGRKWTPVDGEEASKRLKCVTRQHDVVLVHGVDRDNYEELFKHWNYKRS
jgi:hypothetical protein